MDLLFLEKLLVGLFAAVVVAIAVSKIRGRKLRLPPGPLSLPIFGNWLQVGDDLNHRNLSELARRFGDIFLLRMGQRNVVVVSSPTLAREVLHARGAEFGSRGRNVVFDVFTDEGQDMVFASYGDHWRTMRRVMTSPFFTSKVVQRYHAGWEAEATAVVDAVRADPVLALILRKKLASANAVDGDRLKCGMDEILEAQSKGEINADHVLFIVVNINVAAIETTLWAMEWAVAELVNYPEIQRKLRREMDAVLGAGHQITEPDTLRLPYLQAVIKEALRLRMAIPLLVPHMNLRDAELGGHGVPAGSKVLVNAWHLANDPGQWERPDEFRPERFLEEERHVEASGNDFRFLPFGIGRRSCPGIVLALPFLSITVGRLVQSFELLPPPGQERLDTTEKGGQFSLHILKHSTIVAKPRVF